MARRRIGFWYRLVVVLLRPLLMVLTRRDWRGGEHIPAAGGVIICVNHNSYADPFTVGHFLYDHGRLPRYLAKDALFRMPLIGRIVSGAQQIPVYRESRDATLAYSAAVAAVRRGECVTIYPEATLTRDPGLWPMHGKTGAARVALATGAPVIPVAQWGAQRILKPYGKLPRLLPRKTVHVWVGEPVDFGDLAGMEPTPAVLQAATERIVDAITNMLEEIRGEKAPETRWDPRTDGLPRTGNPNRRRR